MKQTRFLLLSTLLFISSTVFSQNKFSISFRNGTVKPEANIRQSFVDSLNRRAVRAGNRSFVVLQFEQLPSESTRKALSANGIELLEYVSGNAYTATVSGNLKLGGLQQAQVRSVLPLSPQQKNERFFGCQQNSLLGCEGRGNRRRLDQLSQNIDITGATKDTGHMAPVAGRIDRRPVDQAPCKINMGLHIGVIAYSHGHSFPVQALAAICHICIQDIGP